MGRKPTYRTHVGISVGASLTETGMSQEELAKEIKESQSTVSKRLAGSLPPNAEWLNAIATAMKFSDEKRRRLLLAGAKDRGFILDDLDLTKK